LGLEPGRRRRAVRAGVPEARRGTGAKRPDSLQKTAFFATSNCPERQGCRRFIQREDGGTIMVLIRAEARHGLRCLSFGFASALLVFGNLPALAAPYSDIVVDANSGNVLHATNPDATRHPASLTKIMTLYLLFEQLETGKLKLDSALKVSEHAAGQSPTKLGLKPGSTIQVEDAIKGIVTRSANDAAVVVAEAIAGEEQEFAKLMTRKAQALGMTRTIYKNASGLPDDDQITTARDQSILGRAIQERFPSHYKFFSTRSFNFRGQRIGNHNHLLGRVEGVDGIKTGYIRASGFNLVTSVHRGNRYVVAVIMGGDSAGSRDARMRELISKQITVAATKRTAPVIAEAGRSSEATMLAQATAKPEPKRAAKRGGAEEAKTEPAPKAKTKPQPVLAAASSTPARAIPAKEPSMPATTESAEMAHPVIAIGSTDPIQPVLVRTLAVRAGKSPAPAPGPLAPVQMAFVEEDETAPAAAAITERNGENEHGGGARVLASENSRPVPPPAAPLPPPTMKTTHASAGARSAEPIKAAATPPQGSTEATAAPAKPQVRSGWAIQVGAFQGEEEAKQRLSKVQSKASKMLDGADPFTESVDKGGTTYYRARFAGLDKEKAEAACKYLKRNDVECVTTKY
jgi:D-alanyl-D-alanine carboxypeptidase